MSDANRRQIARYRGMATRERVYDTAEGIEVESNEGYDVSCWRVFFENVTVLAHPATPIMTPAKMAQRESVRLKLVEMQ